MAKLTDLKPGAKLYRGQATNSKNKSDGRRKREYIAVYVLQVDIDLKKVLASIGGGPAAWHTQVYWSRWLTEKPN